MPFGSSGKAAAPKGHIVISTLHLLGCLELLRKSGFWKKPEWSLAVSEVEKRKAES